MTPEFPEFMKRSTLKMVGSPPMAMLGLAPTMRRQAVLNSTQGWRPGPRPTTTGSPMYGCKGLYGVQSNQQTVGGHFIAGRRVFGR